MNKEEIKIVPENENIDTVTSERVVLAAAAEERIKQLEEELADAKEKAETATKNQLMYYRQVQVLKAAMGHLRTELNITDTTFYSALLVGGRDEIDIDVLLYQLAK